MLSHVAAKQVSLPEEHEELLCKQEIGLRRDGEGGLKDWAGRGRDNGNHFWGRRKQNVDNGTCEILLCQGMQQQVLLEMKIPGRERITCCIHIDTAIFFWLQGERQGHVGER